MAQVRPTVQLLSELDTRHPEILLAHGIQPVDYNGSLVFRSAIERIRGSFIASSTTARERMVEDVLLRLQQQSQIVGFRHTASSERYDFEVKIAPDYYAALEVKGGEGNSIQVSERPIWAQEFGIWCHLDGAIVNQPAHGAAAIVNRVTNDFVRRRKHVDILFFKDILCGTRLRPCPKYPGHEDQLGLNTAPDIFLFPQQVPSLQDPAPPPHTLSTLRLPGVILGLFGVGPDRQAAHIWEVHVRLVPLPEGKVRREIQIVHQGQSVWQTLSRGWQL